VGKKILVIEDEEELGQSIKKFLEQHHYQVTYFNDLTRMESIGVENPDLILTDLLMPHWHGFDICKAVKADPNLKGIPLIAMSAVYKDAFHRLETRRIGVEEFIEKPFKFSDLLKRIEHLLGTGSSEETAPVEEAAEVAEVAEVAEALDGSEWRIRTPAWAIHQSPKAKVPDTLPEEESISPVVEQAVPSVPVEKPALSTQEEANERDKEILAQFQELQQDYAVRLPEKILDLEQSWQRIQFQKPGEELQKQLEEFRRKNHSLTGSGSTFGFAEISQWARQLEQLVDIILAEGVKTISSRKNEINEVLDNMRHHPVVSTELEVLRQMRK
jgi:CheY-like chemotaxis protein/HPt (histidine-containing phosphotransfer) domain-containing protein